MVLRLSLRKMNGFSSGLDQVKRALLLIIRRRSNKASKRHRPTPCPTILAIKHPSFRLPHLKPPTMIPHQRCEAASILECKPIPELSEKNTVQLAEQGCRVVRVSIEGSSASNLSVQAFHKVHLIYTVVVSQLLDQSFGKAPILLSREGCHRPHAAKWPSLAEMRWPRNTKPPSTCVI